MKNWRPLLYFFSMLALISLSCTLGQITGSEPVLPVDIKSVTVSPKHGSGEFTGEVVIVSHNDNDTVQCYVTSSTGGNTAQVFSEPIPANSGTKKLSFKFNNTEPGSHSLSCNDIGTNTDWRSDEFEVVPADAFTLTPTFTPTATPTATATPIPLYTPTSTPLPATWYIRVYNVDDLGTAYVNGSKITEIQFAQDSGWIDVTAYFSAPTNSVRFTMWNGEYGYAWGFAIKRDGVVVWSDVQGEVNVMGADNNDQDRINMTVYDRTIVVNQSGEVTIEP